jgi:hypothetical protein
LKKEKEKDALTIDYKSILKAKMPDNTVRSTHYRKSEGEREKRKK